MDEMEKTVKELRTTIDGLVCKNAQLKNSVEIIKYELGQLQKEMSQFKNEYPEIRNDDRKRNIFGY